MQENNIFFHSGIKEEEFYQKSQKVSDEESPSVFGS
jgi:hypothetical protein